MCLLVLPLYAISQHNIECIAYAMPYLYSIIFKDYVNGYVKHGRQILINICTLAYYLVLNAYIFPFEQIYNNICNQNCLLELKINMDFDITVNTYLITDTSNCEIDFIVINNIQYPLIHKVFEFIGIIFKQVLLKVCTVKYMLKGIR